MTRARINDFIEELIELSEKFGIYIGCNEKEGSLPSLYDEKGHLLAQNFEYSESNEFENVKDCYSYTYSVFKEGDIVMTNMGNGTIVEIEEDKWCKVLTFRDSRIHIFNKNQLEHIDEKTKNMY